MRRAGGVYLHGAGPGLDGAVVCGSRGELVAGFDSAARCVELKGHSWIAWPKKASGVATDLKEDFVREYGLARMWVDFKICAIDDVWSGLCFARR